MKEQKIIIPIISLNKLDAFEIFTQYEKYKFSLDDYSVVKKLFINLTSIFEFIFYLPVVLVWLIRRKRYLYLLKSCLITWFNL